MKILIATETITSGGAEWFAMRTAHALQQNGHEVWLWVMRPDYADARLIDKFSDIRRAGIPAKRSRLLAKIDSLRQKAGLPEAAVHRANVKALCTFITTHRPDVLHSHLIKTDKAIVAANQTFRLPVISTNHGDYQHFYYERPAEQREEYARYLRQIIDGVKYHVTISDHQLAFFKEVLKIDPAKLRSIYNGYPVPDMEQYRRPEKEHFCFGMIARGIREKGWAIAIDAFTQAAIPGTKLILVGESDYLSGLQQQNNNPGIIFRPFTTNALAEIADFNVGLLPSWFASESLPTTIIEYMALGKPTIASDIGEIRQMLQTDNGDAGIIIPLTEDHAVMAGHLKDAMIRVCVDRLFYKEASERSVLAFQKFRMDQCIEAYLALYRS